VWLCAFSSLRVVLVNNVTFKITQFCLCSFVFYIHVHVHDIVSFQAFTVIVLKDSNLLYCNNMLTANYVETEVSKNLISLKSWFIALLFYLSKVFPCKPALYTYIFPLIFSSNICLTAFTCLNFCAIYSHWYATMTVMT